MFKKIITALMLTLSLTLSAQAVQADAYDVYEWMESLEGNWVLSPAREQTGNSYKHKAVLPMVGTNKTGISFKSIGKKVLSKKTFYQTLQNRWLQCTTAKI